MQTAQLAILPTLQASLIQSNAQLTRTTPTSTATRTTHGLNQTRHASITKPSILQLTATALLSTASVAGLLAAVAHMILRIRSATTARLTD